MTARTRREPVHPLRTGPPVIAEKLVQNLRKKNILEKNTGEPVRAVLFHMWNLYLEMKVVRMSPKIPPFYAK